MCELEPVAEEPDGERALSGGHASGAKRMEMPGSRRILGDLAGACIGDLAKRGVER
jgi:hypothetical protein